MDHKIDFTFSFLLIFSRCKTRGGQVGDVLLFIQAQVIPGKNKTGRLRQKMFEKCVKTLFKSGDNGQRTNNITYWADEECF